MSALTSAADFVMLLSTRFSVIACTYIWPGVFSDGPPPRIRLYRQVNREHLSFTNRDVCSTIAAEAIVMLFGFQNRRSANASAVR